ncbi:MAG: hypothetical protein JST82_09660 [Bacteroidetes bacterium]|nr:hypothetical protein [Bacteroidota bacterium]
MQFLLWTIAFILSAAAGYWVYRTDKKRGTPYPWLTAGLRAIVILLTLLLILAPAITITNNETQKPIVVVLQDNSSSIASALGKDSDSYKKNTTELVEKLSGNFKVVTRNLDGNTTIDSLFHYNKPLTDIATALNDIQDYYGTQNLGAVILASDGRYNQGNNPQYQQNAFQCPVYTVGIGDTSLQKDIRIAQAYSNKTVSLNSQFEIRADIIASLCNGYNNNVLLTEGGSIITSSSLSVNSVRYDKSVSFSVKADKPGLHHYVITIPVADGEKNTANNRRDVFVEVTDEKKNILILTAAPHPDVNAIKEALSSIEGYHITIASVDKMPSLNNYDVLIMHSLPSMANNIQQYIHSAEKPVWYVLGGQSSNTGLAGLQKPVITNINPAILRDALPSFNTSFSSFTTPQNLQAVIDKMPPLSLPSGNLDAAGNTDILIKQRDGNTPLWILQQGTTPTAMLTGEGIWRWRMYEYKNFNTHNTIDECIRQTVAFLAANTNSKPFSASMPKYIWSDQEAVTINAYLLNAAKQQINTPDAQLSITDSAGKKQDFSFERSGNSYRLNTGIWPGGTYHYAARTNYNGQTYTANGSFVIEHLSLEQMETGADYNLLFSLSKKYNGSFVPASNILSLADSISKNNNIKPVIQTNVQSVPLVDWKWYFLLILVFAVAEWLLRKYWLAQ